MRFLYRFLVAYTLERLFIKPDPGRIKRGAITADMLTSNAVTSSKLATRQVTNARLGSPAIRSC